MYLTPYVNMEGRNLDDMLNRVQVPVDLRRAIPQ
jgi:hypothetical protein